jgi:hypothetical protein
MPKTVEIFRAPDSQRELANAQQQQMLAQALMKGGQSPDDMFAQWNRMPIVPKYSLGAGLAQMGSQLAGAYMNKQANDKVLKVEQAEKDAKEKAQREAMAKILQRTVTTQTQPGPYASGYVNEGDTAQRPKTHGEILADAMVASESGVPKEIVEAYIKANEGYTLDNTRYLANQPIASAPQKPMDPVAQLQADLEAGRINLKDAMARKEILTTRSPGTTVNVNTDKNLYGTLADSMAKQYSDLYSAAQAAPEAIERTGRIRELLKTAPYTGSGANYKLAIGKGARALGFNYAEDDAANTEALAAEMARATLDNIKSSGLAGSQGLTEGERKFLAQAVAGEITLEPKTIGRLADLNERTARLTLNRWNQTAERLDQDQLKTLGMSRIDQPMEPQGGPPKGKLKKNADGSYDYVP